MELVKRPEIRFLSELYACDAADAVLLAEYPSSNSNETRFQNRSRFIIHDPFPPPRGELLKVLGPHHLMCGWGHEIDVTSQVAPPTALLEHWERTFGANGRPKWQAFDDAMHCIALFPHESIPATQQVVDPVTNYAVHSKEVIEKIDCSQADVLQSVKPPCIVKLSHGYAGLGNFFVREPSDEAAMREQLARHWPDAKLVVNSIIDHIVGDFGVQFYLTRQGKPIWLGLTQQNFDHNMRWCGGTFSAAQQEEFFEEFRAIVEPTARYLAGVGYFGVVGIDILRDRDGRDYLVDLNPRLTGISPFLMASRIFAADHDLTEGIYQASARFSGSMDELFDVAENMKDARVLILSVFEQPGESTICHISASSNSQSSCLKTLQKIVGKPNA